MCVSGEMKTGDNVRLGSEMIIEYESPDRLLIGNEPVPSMILALLIRVL